MASDERYNVPDLYKNEADKWVWCVGFAPSKYGHMTHPPSDANWTVDDYIRSMGLDADNADVYSDLGPWMDEGTLQAAVDAMNLAWQKWNDVYNPGALDWPYEHTFDHPPLSLWFRGSGLQDAPQNMCWDYERPKDPKDIDNATLIERAQNKTLQAGWCVARAVAGILYRYYRILVMRDALQIQTGGKGGMLGS